MKKEKAKICFECSLPLEEKEGTWVLLGTYNRLSKPDSEVFFHFPCYVEHFNRAVLNRAKAMVGDYEEDEETPINITVEDITKAVSSLMNPYAEKNKKKPQKRKNGTKKTVKTKKRV